MSERSERSERIERWKARDTIQSDVGWVAVFIGLAGLLVIARGLAKIAIDNIRGARPALVAILIGIALLYCAEGLWKAKAWARWVAVVLCAAACATGFSLAFLATAYLLLPSTGRRFARAQGARARAESGDSVSR